MVNTVSYTHLDVYKRQLSNLFGDDRFKDAKKITLQNDLDANYNELCEVLDDHISVVTAAKDVYDAARFSGIIGTHSYLCDAKIAVYKQNNIDLRALKEYIKAHCIELYNSCLLYTSHQSSHPARHYLPRRRKKTYPPAASGYQ